MKKDGTELTRIYFKGWKYSLGTFPYQLRKEGSAYYAIIPAEDYEQLFPEQERKEEEKEKKMPLAKGETQTMFKIGS